VEEGDGAVVPGALAVQCRFGAVGLLAQRGDRVAGGVEARGGGGERGGMLAGVVLTCGCGVAAGGAGRGERVVALALRACGFLAGGVQGSQVVLACGGLSVERGDGFGGGGACFGGVRFGGVPGGCLRGGLGAGLLDPGGGPGADRLDLRLGGQGISGGSKLLADGGELVQRCGQLPGQPGHRSQRVVADRRGPPDRGGNRPVLAGLPRELLTAPERGHRGMPDRRHRAVPVVLGDLLLAVPGPGTRRGVVLDPRQVRASRIPACPARQPGRRRRLGGGGGRHRCCPLPARAERQRTRNEIH
jgi:hypothetical protein